MLITAVVTSVLFRPISAPEAITTAITAGRLPGQMPMTASAAATSTRLAYSVRAVPKRRLSSGAPNTAKIATSTPQAQNTAPSRSGDRPIRNGA